MSVLSLGTPDGGPSDRAAQQGAKTTPLLQSPVEEEISSRESTSTRATPACTNFAFPSYTTLYRPS